jgi:DUF971 family protein
VSGVSPAAAAPTAAPVEIRHRRADRRLEVTWADGRTDSLDAEYLRVESPSAEVQGHTPEQRQWVAGKAGVGIAAIEPVGHYAVRLLFDDGHESGIYSWDYLRTLAAEHATRWPRYLEELEVRGLSRTPSPRSR